MDRTAYGSSCILQWAFHIFFAIGMCAILILSSSSLFQPAQAAAVTAPAEVQILKTVANKMGITSWNFSVDPCGGQEGWDRSTNMGISCDCTFDNNSTCHVTQMIVYDQDVIGVIPNELAQLSHLSDLNLAKNVLSGPIPQELGSMTKMQYLSLDFNNLSGSVPRSLGNLVHLISLSFSSNNLSGPLPPEIGNLQSLTQLCIDSSGLSGEIPSQLGYLRKLQKLWASDNPFSGTIPDFFGNMTGLTDLRIQGTSLQGPIPSSLVELRSLKTLRLGDISSGGSLLPGITNSQNLTELSLRNNGLSGKLVAQFGELNQLQYLDLSFNNLTGEIPTSFESLTFLTMLLLGNNNLTGEIPPELAAAQRLATLDISYNRFSGDIPAWISSGNLQVPAMDVLKCPQQSFACNKADPINSFLALNCGGEKQVSSTGTVYEADNQTLGAASFYVNSRQTWGVSNTGIFLDSSSPSFLVNTLAQISGTSDSGLYQTARASASSLRYYGLGMENGLYNIQLFFAEISITDAAQEISWRSSGRRVFDVYIQGIRELQDFNIKDEAKGSFRAVVKNFTAEVKDSFLEIHLFWAGKGTCCIPQPGTYGPLISAIRVDAGFPARGGNIPTTLASKKSTRFAKVIGIIAGALVSTLALCCSLIVFWRRNKFKEPPTVNEEEEQEIWSIENRPNMFTYNELKVATGGFHPQNKLGEGGFGTVFKAWKMYEKNTPLELVDPNLIPSYNQEEAWRLIQVSLLCTQAVPAMRPRMSDVVAMLTGHVGITGTIIRPGFLSDWKHSATATRDQKAHASSGAVLVQVLPAPSSKSSIIYSDVEAR